MADLMQIFRIFNGINTVDQKKCFGLSFVIIVDQPSDSFNLLINSISGIRFDIAHHKIKVTVVILKISSILLQ